MADEDEANKSSLRSNNLNRKYKHTIKIITERNDSKAPRSDRHRFNFCNLFVRLENWHLCKEWARRLLLQDSVNLHRSKLVQGAMTEHLRKPF